MNILMLFGPFIPLGLLITATVMLIVFFINRKKLGLFWKIVLPLGACLIILGVLIMGIVTVMVLKSVVM